MARPPLGGWAAGGYQCACCHCKEQFLGAKLAWECENCAYERADMKQSDIEEIIEEREAVDEANKVEILNISMSLETLETIKALGFTVEDVYEAVNKDVKAGS